MAVTQVTVPYINGYNFGVGADLASGSPMGKVVDGAPTGVTAAEGATTSFDITRIHSTSELEKALGIDVEASYGCASFGAGISARFSFAQKSKVQSSSLFLAITANVALEFLSIDDPALTADARDLVNRPDVFATRYGNMFVRGVGRGGLFVAVMRVDTSSSDESESISAELEGSYGLFSADAKTKFEEVTKASQSEIRISVYHEGGPVNLTMTDVHDPNELYRLMQEWLNALQTDPAHNAKPYYVTLAPIAIANGPLPPNAADIEHAQDVLVLCAKARSGILDQLNLLSFINDNQSKYDFPPPTTLDAVKQGMRGYEADLDLVAHTASQAINHPDKAVTPSEYAQANGKTYPSGSMPDPMPAAKAGTVTSVPDFRSCASWDECVNLAAQSHLQAVESPATGEPPGTSFHVISQTPNPGDPAPEGSTVTIVTRPMQQVQVNVDPRIFTTLEQARERGLLAGPHIANP